MSEAISVHHGDFGRAALYQLDKPIITHAHREGHLIFSLNGCRSTVTVGDQTFPVDDVSGVAVSPWEPHNFELADPGTTCLCLVLYIKPLWFLETSQSAEFALSFGRPHIRITPDILRAVNRLTTLLLEEERADIFDNFLFEVTSRCFNQSWQDSNSVCSLNLRQTKFTDYRVRRSLRLMQARFTGDVGMDWLARESGLSRPHFFKLFKKQMGITPNLYLNTLRYEHAIEDLLTTDKSVTEISYGLGFSSQASFTRFFSSNVGIPPSEYRRVAHQAEFADMAPVGSTAQAG